MNKICKIIKNPKLIIIYLMGKGYFKFLSDKIFIKLKYKLMTNKKLDLKEPHTYNEKLQWLKLYDRKDEYTLMVDKYEAKKYVANKIGNQYIIPTIGVYNNFEEIDFNLLPSQFVIKCTHDSGGLVICKDKSKININETKKIIKKSLRRNYYYTGREWPYKNVKPRIIVEKYMEDKNSNTMKDYKFFCFNGEPKIMYLSEGLENHATARMSFFDMNFKITTCKRTDYKLLDYTPQKPVNFEKMKEFAKILSKDIPHVRLDFYEINGKLYFGELTFSTCSGYVSFEDEEWNYKLGSYIDII